MRPQRKEDYPNKPSIRELKGKHGSLPIAILGGGPSLPEDIKKLPKDCILIGVNHHYTKLDIEADYCVFMDKFEPGKRAGLDIMQNCIANIKETIKITKYWIDSDYCLDINYWDGGFSSTTALWLGSYISSGDLLLCGMDCYQGKPYFYNTGIIHNHPIYRTALPGHLKAWSPALKEIENSERIKAVSGPLIELFGEYKLKR